MPKNAMPNDLEFFRKIEMNTILYAGSKCETVFTNENETNTETLGIVINVGFATLNGKMIKSVLTPRIEMAQIEKDLNKFLFVLISISVIGAIAYIIFYTQTNQVGISQSKAAIRALELLTIGVPPFLGLCLIQSNYYAILRIEKENINCLSHYQLNIAGTIRTIMFDKTGTITENELTLKNYIEYTDQGQMNLYNPSEFSILSEEYRIVIQACHSLFLRDMGPDKETEVDGDMLEIEMFKYSKSRISSKNSDTLTDMQGNVILTKLKIFQFSAYKKRMGVIVENAKTKKKYFISKGAYESIDKGRINKENEKLMRTTSDNYTKTGSRLIALAYKELNEKEVRNMEVWTEEDYFNNLTFVGFLNFNNAIKPNVKASMDKLGDCGITKAMISGDNEYACAFIGYKVGIMREGDILNFVNHKDGEFEFQTIKYLGDRLLVENIDAKSHPVFSALADVTLKDEDFKNNKFDKLNPIEKGFNQSGLATAIDSSNYHFMINNSAYEFLKNTNQLSEVLATNTRIFSRMTPSTKSEIVELFKKLKGKDYKIAFVGDGSNDVRAMKISDIGISFIGCEASISAGFVIPFNEFPLIIRVIAEGKACLENCMELFKYISFYALAQFSGVIIQYFYNNDYKTGMYYIQDIFIVMPISIFLCFHGAGDLVKEYPTQSLFSLPVFIIIFGCWLILLAGLIGASFYITSVTNDNIDGPTRLTSTMFLVVTSNINTAMLIFVRGKPFRKSITSNKMLMGWFFFMQSFLTYLMFINIFTPWTNMNEWFLENIEFAVLYDQTFICILVTFCSIWTLQWILNKSVFYFFKLA